MMTGKCLMGRYLVGEVIGTGGMAVVYKGHDLRSGRTVAIKILRKEFNQDEEFVLRFQREAQAASLISHENLIDLYDVGEQDEMHFIVMEYVDGLTLKELIQRQGALDNYTSISIARQMCLALKLVHEAKIIHRDIKSQNILLDRKGIAKLADFGIARAADSDTQTLSGDKGVLGSVHYFSPEQAKGERATQSSDLYSLGVVLFEMITGRVPFDGDTPVNVALHHINTPVPSVRTLNPRATKAIDEIIQKAMEKDPSKRYQDAQSFYNDLCMALVYPEGGFIQREEGGAKPFDKEEKPLIPEGSHGKGGGEGRAKGWLQRGGRRLRNLPVVLISLVLLIAGVAVTFVVLFSLGIMPGWTNAPQLVGLQLAMAEERVEELGLHLALEAYSYDDSIQPGTVIEQEPSRGSPLRLGGTMRVVLCKGPEFPIVPRLIGLSLEQARQQLEAKGLSIGQIIPQEDSDEPRDTVLEQSIDEGVQLNNGDSIDLVVSAPPLVRTVPNLEYCTVAEARALLEAEGLELGEIYNDHMAGYEVGQVFQQQPASQTSLLDGESVDIWVNTALASYRYEAELEIFEDDTYVRIYMEDQGNMKMIYEEIREAGVLSIDLNLESEVPGYKDIIVYFNETEYSRETVYFAEEGQ